MDDFSAIAELQDFGEREQCNYIFQKGINIDQQCPPEIPLGNRFCRTHAKTAFAKKLLSLNEIVVEKEEEVEVEDRKKTFDNPPLKKRESKRRMLILIPKSSNYLRWRKKKTWKRFWPTCQKKSQRKRKEALMKR